MRIGSLFSGAGGLDMAVEQVFGATTAWHCELDPAASKVLAHRWPGVPNLEDIRYVDWMYVRRRNPVDILCGGFPCQDVSSAGRRAGIKDGTRSGLWAMFTDAIAALRPRIVVVENVRGLLSAQAHRAVESADPTVGDGSDGPVLRAAGAVLGDLADLGFDAQWATVAASNIGAPHRRERVFIVAHTQLAGSRRETDDACWGKPDTGRCDLRIQPERRCAAHAHTSRDGRHEGRPESARLVGGSDAAVGGAGPVELLPTPVVNDMGDGKTVDWWDNWTAEKKRQHGNGNGHGNSLAIEVQRTLLPTPTSCDYKPSDSRSDHERHSPGLGAVSYHFLPTPNASDGEFGTPRTSDRPIEKSTHLQTIASLTAQWGKYEPAIRRWENLTRPAPSPTEPNTKGNPRLAAAFSEWLMGWPAGWVTAVPGISRNDQLRIIGNGVCPKQAVAALRWLLSVGEAVA